MRWILLLVLADVALAETFHRREHICGAQKANRIASEYRTKKRYFADGSGYEIILTCNEGFAIANLNFSRTASYNCYDNSTILQHTDGSGDVLYLDECLPYPKAYGGTLDCKEPTGDNLQVIMRCDGNMCVMEMKCDEGYIWAGESNINLNRGKRFYTCQQGVYKNPMINPILDQKSYELTEQCVEEKPCEETDVIEMVESDLYFVYTCAIHISRNYIECVMDYNCDPFAETFTQSKQVYVTATNNTCDRKTKQWIVSGIEQKQTSRELYAELCGMKPYKAIDEPKPEHAKNCIYKEDASQTVYGDSRPCWNDHKNPCKVALMCNRVNESDVIPHVLECDRTKGLWIEGSTGNTYHDANDVCRVKPNCLTSLSLHQGMAIVKCAGDICAYDITCKRFNVWTGVTQITREFWTCTDDGIYKKGSVKSSLYDITYTCGHLNVFQK